MKNNLIEIIYEIIKVSGNPCLENIFLEYKDNEGELYNKLKDYYYGIYEEIYEDNDENEKKDKNYFKYLIIKNTTLDITNISRIELGTKYNNLKNRNDFFIKFIKKYPSPLEEEFYIFFDSEEKRDREYEILKAKLKLCNIYIC